MSCRTGAGTARPRCHPSLALWDTGVAPGGCCWLRRAHLCAQPGGDFGRNGCQQAGCAVCSLGQAQSSHGNILSDRSGVLGDTCDSPFLGSRGFLRDNPEPWVCPGLFSSPISAISGHQGLCQTPAIPTECDKYHPKHNNINTYNHIKITPNRSDICACLWQTGADWHTTFPQIFAASNPDETEKFSQLQKNTVPSLPVSTSLEKQDIPKWILHQHRVRQQLRGLCLGRAQVKGKAGKGSLSSAPSAGNKQSLVPPCRSHPRHPEPSKPFCDGRHPWMSHRKQFAFPSANLSSNPSPTSPQLHPHPPPWARHHRRSLHQLRPLTHEQQLQRGAPGCLCLQIPIFHFVGFGVVVFLNSQPRQLKAVVCVLKARLGVAATGLGVKWL